MKTDRFSLKAPCIWALCAIFLIFRPASSLSASDFTFKIIGDTRINGWSIHWGDVNGDGYLDIVANQTLYLSPGGNLMGTWQTRSLPTGLGFFIYDVDRDGIPDIIGNAGTNLYWFKTRDRAVSGFDQFTVATNIVPDHGTTEGYVVADFDKRSSHKEFMISFVNNQWHYYSIPDNPRTTWPNVRVCTNAIDEAIGVGDIDGDGHLDVAGGMPLRWWRNPGTGGGDWQSFSITTGSDIKVDIPIIADINGDGKMDIVCVLDTEKNNVLWFQNPGNPLTNNTWTRHQMPDVLGQGHGGDAGDLDGDGDIDVVVSSTTGNWELRIYVNDGKGNFTSFAAPAPGSTGDVHNTLKLVDLDNDGDLDIIGVGWFNTNLRLWRNDASQKGKIPCDPDRMLCVTGAINGSRSIPPQPSMSFDHVRNTVTVSASGHYSLSLYDSRGRRVVSGADCARSCVLELSRFPAGMYRAVIKGSGISVSRSISIVR